MPAPPPGEGKLPFAAILTGKGGGGFSVPRLAGFEVEPAAPPAVDDIRIVRVGRDLVRLAACRDLVELGDVDAVILAVAAARDRGRARILLRAVNPVWISVVGGDVIELARRLVVPAAPGLSAVQGDQRPLVDPEDSPIRVLRVDPQGVEVVARRVALQRNKMRAAVVRAQLDRILHPDLVGVLGVGGDLAEIPATVPDALVASDLVPGRTRIVGPVEPTLALLRAVDQRIDAVRPRGARRQSDPRRLGRQAATGELPPRLS